MIQIMNNIDCFIRLWTELDKAADILRETHRRFCPRRILELWYGPEATDDFIWEVCTRCEILGLNELPTISVNHEPAKCMLCALVAVKLGIGLQSVKVNELNDAFHLAFTEPGNTRRKTKKKRRHTKKRYTLQCYS